MEKIFYVTDAYASSYQQGAYLVIVKSPSGVLFGVSCEFEDCTADIAMASVSIGGNFDEADEKYSKVNWVPYSEAVGMVPAAWEDIINSGLSEYVIGYQLESELEVHRFK
ncbi:hypothetical protein [Pseudomonas citronellolis]|uniref:hypothetical protein n=1 Tax=Pseudomonas citronellolis TaxID=53408 RepID=UPI000778DC40|nr:hypothetical protein [Pseudomonas citronellolis]